MKKCYCLLPILFFIVFTSTAQRVKTPKNVVAVLQSIEQKSGWVFNYDPKALSAFTFTGSLELKGLEAQLATLLYATPYTFEITGQSVLIFLAPLQTYRICGYIKDKISQQNLYLANIYTSDFQQGTQTNEQGFFDFNITVPKHQEITISYVGYQPITRMVQAFDSLDCTTFSLAIDEELFGEPIIVKDYLLQEITEGEAYSSVNIDFQQLLRKQSVIEQDVLKTVQLIPGVNSIDETATNLQIRGGTPDQNLVLWEGATLYDPGHFFGMISAVNPYVVDDIQVYKGAFDPSYDNRIGGIVDLSLSDSISTDFHGGVGSTFSEAHAYFQLPVSDKLSFLVAGRNDVNGIINSPTINNYSSVVFQETKIEAEQEEVTEGDREVDQILEFKDANAKVIFQPTNRMTFKGSWLKTYNRFDYTSILSEEALKTRDLVTFDSEAFSLTSNIQWTDRWQTKLGWLSSDYQNDYTFTLTDEREGVTSLSNNVFNTITDRTFLLVNDLTISPNLAIKFGYDYNVKEVNFTIDIDSDFEEDVLDSNFAKGHFHNGHISFNYQQKNWQIDGGIRGTYYREARDMAFSPRLNIQYAIRDNLKWKLSGGIFQQYISQLREFGENDLGLNTSIWVINRSELEDVSFQSGEKIASGFVFHQNGWLIDLEGYFYTTNNLTTLSRSFGASNLIEEDFALGNATAKGIDILVKKRWNTYNMWVNYSLSEVENSFPTLEDFDFPASNDQRHKLSWVNTFTYKQWTFSINYQFKSGLPFTDAIGIKEAIEEIENEETGEIGEEEIYSIEYSTTNANRLNNYHRLDAGFSYRPMFKKGKIRVELTFSMLNLLNQSNTVSRNYFLEDYPEDEPPFILALDRRLLGRTPLLSLRFYW